MKTRIIVDSSADMTPAIKERVHIIPLNILFGTTEYTDGVTIDHKTFYTMLEEGKVLPTTCQATPIDYIREYEKAKEANEACVVITLASKLSGTHQNALIAARDYENVYVVDSKTAAIGTTVLIEYALSLLDEGLEAKEIAEELNKVTDKVVVLALMGTLECLKKGGRISSTVAFAGGILNIKPIICLNDGTINIVGKARGLKQGNIALTNQIEKTGGIDYSKPSIYGHTGVSDENLKVYLKESKSFWKPHFEKARYTTIGSVVGTHIGPGAVGIAFFKNI